MGRHVIKNSYEYLYARLLTNAGKVHEKNKIRVKIAFLLMILLPFIMEGIRRLTDAGRIAFLIGWVIGMFLLSAYLVTVDYLDHRMRSSLVEMTGKKETFDPLLGNAKHPHYNTGRGSSVFSLLYRDIRRLFSNVVALVILIGLCLVPCLYAWFNILSNWDPYEPESTGNIPFAVCSLDRGVKIGEGSLNMGDLITDNIKTNDAMGWVFTESKKEAVDGVRSGKYYAAIVIPGRFSEAITSFTGDRLTFPKIRYYENDKKNAIAPKITGKGKEALRKELDHVFVSALGQMAVEASAAAEEQDAPSREELLDISASCNRLADSLRNGIVLVEAASTLSDGGDAMLGASEALLESAGGSLDVGSRALEEAEQNRPEPIQVPGLPELPDPDEENLSEELGNLQEELEEVRKTPEAYASFCLEQGNFQKLRNALKKQYSILDKARKSKKAFRKNFLKKKRHGILIKRLLEIKTAAEDIHERLLERRVLALENRFARIEGRLSEAQRRLALLEEADEEIWSDTQDTLDAVCEDLKSVEEEVGWMADSAKEEIDLRQKEVREDIDRAYSDMKKAISDSRADLDGLDRTLSSARQSMHSLDRGLVQTENLLFSAEADSRRMSAEFRELSDQKVFSDMSHLSQLDAEEIAKRLSVPVDLKTETIYPVSHYGSAMAPFYTVLAQGVGALFAAVLIHAHIEAEDRKKAPGLLTRYMARYLLFAMVGLVQALVVSGGDLLFLRIQCHHPVMFVLAACMNGLVFTMIDYALVFALGNVGLAAGLVILLVQVPGSGGTFPVELLPEPFQALYPYMPFHFSLQAMRECVGGVYQDMYGRALGALCILFAAAFVLGLILYLPGGRLTRRMEESLKKCEVIHS